MPRRYASNTKVSVAQSRSQIDKILREWGCDAVRWTDDYKHLHVVVEFAWENDGTTYPARFELFAPDVDARTETQRINKVAGEWRRLHRVLFEWLKMCFNAVDSGLVRAEEVFLPFIVDAKGQTLGKALLPRMPELLTSSTQQALGLPAHAEENR